MLKFLKELYRKKFLYEIYQWQPPHTWKNLIEHVCVVNHM